GCHAAGSRTADVLSAVPSLADPASAGTCERPLAPQRCCDRLAVSRPTRREGTSFPHEGQDVISRNREFVAPGCATTDAGSAAEFDGRSNLKENQAVTTTCRMQLRPAFSAVTPTRSLMRAGDFALRQ